jgi:hypothetical protein
MIMGPARLAHSRIANLATVTPLTLGNIFAIIGFLPWLAAISAVKTRPPAMVREERW